MGGAVQEVATGTIVSIASSALTLVATLVVILAMNPWLELVAFMEERLNIGGMLLAKLFGWGEADADHFAERNRGVMDLNVKQATTGRWLFMCLTVFSVAGPAVIYLYGGTRQSENSFRPAAWLPSSPASPTSTARSDSWPTRMWLSKAHCPCSNASSTTWIEGRMSKTDPTQSN